ncbi:MAG: translation initiation factor 2 [Lachnospiraceae bacterium]|nr:translation initiation factor 2 [Lachnospiraceae bacterium]
MTKDVKCPICGTVNHNLYLDETDGWMECECCKNVTCLMENLRTKKVPVFTGKQLAQMDLVSVSDVMKKTAVPV